VTALRRIKIVECGEPLVDFRELCPEVVFMPPIFKYRRETLLRLGVAERLHRASLAVPDGYRLGIFEGWRPPHIQRRMYEWSWRRFAERHPEWSDVQLRRVVNRFTAPPDSKVPPPHSTGGALDVTLIGEDGEVVDFYSPYERRDPHAFPFAAPKLSSAAVDHRQILRAALAAGEITNYPSEYWHYSFGDQGWAYRDGHPHAIYGRIEPIGWVPNPDDDTDAPLEYA